MRRRQRRPWGPGRGLASQTLPFALVGYRDQHSAPPFAAQGTSLKVEGPSIPSSLLLVGCEAQRVDAVPRSCQWYAIACVSYACVCFPSALRDVCDGEWPLKRCCQELSSRVSLRFSSA
jgi:hypothetical protein